MGGITMRADRALVGRFTRPYAEVGTVVLVPTRDAGRIASLDALDAPGMRIAVNAGGHLERVARARFPRATIDAVADNQAVPQRLRDGDADAAITDTAEVQAWLSPGLRALGPFNIDYKAYLLPAGDAARAARIDEWMTAREREGWLNDQRLRWIGPDAGLDTAAAERVAVVGLIRLRLELAPAIGAAKRAVDLPIEDRDQEARVLERASASAASNRARVTAVYRQLIELSKLLQAPGVESSVAAELPALRNALARIDAALVPVLATLPPADPTTWNESLNASITHPAIPPAQLNALAAADQLDLVDPDVKIGVGRVDLPLNAVDVCRHDGRELVAPASLLLHIREQDFMALPLGGELVVLAEVVEALPALVALWRGLHIGDLQAHGANTCPGLLR
jgi:cyclohexadienyl dehydratase